ncbi:hypothetical protein K432DRAFT_409195 [Lepidopterella palustris CBS 459.81]|uniref:Uncharacterized protein n=1 Tax=Lepidopterella palustris CBS 459.81 TaxID=1314670 RepID=A0A8E2E0Z2_9PEZI|nr:hypothetical protein K432DRAFT_409195 [Lepidopterella palustris CBS 459.81]
MTSTVLPISPLVSMALLPVLSRTCSLISDYLLTSKESPFEETRSLLGDYNHKPLYLLFIFICAAGLSTLPYLSATNPKPKAAAEPAADLATSPTAESCLRTNVNSVIDANDWRLTLRIFLHLLACRMVEEFVTVLDGEYVVLRVWRRRIVYQVLAMENPIRLKQLQDAAISYYETSHYLFLVQLIAILFTELFLHTASRLGWLGWLWRIPIISIIFAAPVHIYLILRIARKASGRKRALKSIQNASEEGGLIGWSTRKLPRRRG